MRKLWIAVVTAVLFICGGIVAWASIPGPDGVVHGCYKTSNPNTGNVIAVDHTASCPSGYASLNWSVGPAAGTIYDAVPSVGSYVHDTGAPVQIQTCPSGRVTISAWAFTSAKVSVPAQINHQAVGAFGSYVEIHGTSSIPNGTTIYWGMVCARVSL